MLIFEDTDDVVEWLAPLDYLGFWEAVEPYAIFPDGDRDHCDTCIAKRGVPQEQVLKCLKAMARVQLTERLGLQHRIYEPVNRQYLRSTH
ncbi:MAG: hypothetical protein AAF441_17360 [Pseudomonadota bacterium]